MTTPERSLSMAKFDNQDFFWSPLRCRVLKTFESSADLHDSGFGSASEILKSKGSCGDDDLGYVLAVLTTEGANKNGDFFGRSELLKAQKTPILKPMNLEHDKNRIVGVIYDSRVATSDDHAVIPDSAIEIQQDGELKLSAEYDDREIEILVAIAIYRYNFPEVYENIVTAAANGGAVLFSMETWYTDYSYIVGSKTVKRDKTTAYLDKQINKTVGQDRVLRFMHNLTFGGIAKVDTPAQPKSIMLAAAKNQAVADGKIPVDSYWLGTGYGDHSHNENNPWGYHYHTMEEFDRLIDLYYDDKLKSGEYLDELGGHRHDQNNALGIHSHSADMTPGGPHFHIPPGMDAEALLFYGGHYHAMLASYASEAAATEPEKDDEERKDCKAELETCDPELIIFGLAAEVHTELLAKVGIQVGNEVDTRFPLEPREFCQAAIDYFTAAESRDPQVWRRIQKAAKKLEISLLEDQQALIDQASEGAKASQDANESHEGGDVGMAQDPSKTAAVEEEKVETQAAETKTESAEDRQKTIAELQSKTAELETKITELETKLSETEMAKAEAEKGLQDLKAEIELDKRTEERMAALKAAEIQIPEDKQKEVKALVRTMEDQEFESFKGVAAVIGVKPTPEAVAGKEEVETEPPSAPAKAKASTGADGEGSKLGEISITADSGHRVL